MGRPVLTEPGYVAKDINHGVTGYNNYHCRCLTCRAAVAALARRRKARQIREQEDLLARIAELEAQLEAQ